MNLLVGVVASFVWAGAGVADDAKKASMTAQQKRGHELFLHSTKGAACATCHALAGEGTAVGPDLTNLASAATPAGMRVAILSTQTVYVLAVKPVNGTLFPGMKVKEDSTTADYFDLSQMPPVLRTLNKKEIESTATNSEWKHPPGSADYTPDELADVIAYIRYVAKGDTKPVTLN
jgi:mono/diheme cytochrome c family protein